MESTHTYFYRLKLYTQCNSPYKALNLQPLHIHLVDGKYLQTSGEIYHQQLQL